MLVAAFSAPACGGHASFRKFLNAMLAVAGIWDANGHFFLPARFANKSSRICDCPYGEAFILDFSPCRRMTGGSVLFKTSIRICSVIISADYICGGDAKYCVSATGFDQKK